MDRQCSSDVQRWRTSRLSRSDEIRLSSHLAACASCRLEQQLFTDFDNEGCVRPGDDILDARLAERLGKGSRHVAGFARRGRGAWVLAAAACLLLATAAVADVLGEHSLRASAVALTAAPAALPVPGPPKALDTRPALAPAPMAIDDDEVAPPAPSPVHAGLLRPAARLRETSESSAPAVAPGPSASEKAAELFDAANEARRHHRLATAISLYDQLQGRYPDSHEARVSRVSLGRLLIERGMWSDALFQFEAYLSSNDDGTLVPEALVGQARALDTLGRRDEAATAWNRLVTRFGDSVYGSEARQRLGLGR